MHQTHGSRKGERVNPSIRQTEGCQASEASPALRGPRHSSARLIARGAHCKESCVDLQQQNLKPDCPDKDNKSVPSRVGILHEYQLRSADRADEYNQEREELDCTEAEKY